MYAYTHTHIYICGYIYIGFPDGSVVKNPPAKAGDVSSIPGSVRSPGKGNGNSLQCSCLGNLMEDIAYEVTESDTIEHSTEAAIYIQCNIYSEELANVII